MSFWEVILLAWVFFGGLACFLWDEMGACLAIGGGILLMVIMLGTVIVQAYV